MFTIIMYHKTFVVWVRNTVLAFIITLKHNIHTLMMENSPQIIQNACFQGFIEAW